MYNTIDDIIQAVRNKEVDGMLLDRYRASYYQSKGKLKSLVTAKRLEYRRDIGVLFSKNNQGLAVCLDFYRSEIWRLVQTLTATFKVILTLIVFFNYILTKHSYLWAAHYLDVHIGIFSTSRLPAPVVVQGYRHRHRHKLRPTPTPTLTPRCKSKPRPRIRPRPRNRPGTRPGPRTASRLGPTPGP